MRERILHIEIELEASVAEVWKCWTTPEGVKSFFAPSCNLEMKPDGAYEIFFFPNNPIGMRGADGQRVMAIEPEKMLSFTWNFPPNLAEIRDQRTIVVLRFRNESGKTKLSLSQMGWGESPIWSDGFEYFKAAWTNVVLARLQHRIRHGPIDWSKPPSAEELKA